ncbi:MAG: DeoR/GlpR family DNA-binding transcription regulator [Spirochaetaceae bacterium]|jgi:DeoR/GlpR family transcriptional regulator of sugar metabolism|nr:DeoR/GlpR family DNA-binding transcription regulator [Spirochaetaceae bacterium]
MKDRKTKILEVLTQNRRIEVTALADMLKVSPVTMRKDLNRLEEQGLIRRKHGFASIGSTDDVGMRLAYHYGVKRRIADAAAESVENGETVLIESGSCCALLAEVLANEKRDVTIITNSAFIANHIRYAPGGKTVLLGGYYQKESQVTVGPITRKCAELFLFDKFFIGADGFTEKFGFTGKDLSRAQTVQDLAELTASITVLTESEKFACPGVVKLVSAESVQALYTDDNIPQSIEAYLKEKNIAVHTVSAYI